MNEEIIERLAEKHDMSEEQVKLIIKSFYDGLRHYLSHPLEAKGGVMVHGLLTFYINEKKLKKQIEKIELKQFTNKQNAYEEKLTFHNDILENISKYERQKSNTTEYQ